MLEGRCIRNSLRGPRGCTRAAGAGELDEADRIASVRRARKGWAEGEGLSEGGWEEWRWWRGRGGEQRLLDDGLLVHQLEAESLASLPLPDVLPCFPLYRCFNLPPSTL